MKKLLLSALLLAATLASAQSGAAIVIRNVTLIDGTGRAPLAGATVVIEGNRFRQVGTTGQAPAGARVDRRHRQVPHPRPDRRPHPPPRRARTRGQRRTPNRSATGCARCTAISTPA